MEAKIFLDLWDNAHKGLFAEIRQFECNYKVKDCPKCDGYDNWKEIPEDLKQNYQCKHLIQAKANKFDKETSKVIEELILAKLVETESRRLCRVY
jgi:hypothetical protein